MSTKIQDFANNAILGAGLVPQSITASINGSAADMINGDGVCVAIQQIGSVSGTSPTLAGKIQESADGSTGWTDVATFTTVTTSTNTQALVFERTKRYLRYVATVGGTSPSFAIAVIISQQKKQV